MDRRALRADPQAPSQKPQARIDVDTHPDGCGSRTDHGIDQVEVLDAIHHDGYPPLAITDRVRELPKGASINSRVGDDDVVYSTFRKPQGLRECEGQDAFEPVCG